MAHRSVSRVVHAITTLEGEGFLVHRPFPTPQLDDIDPFLLLDRMGPVTLASGEAKGAPDHPHRGFETVTYVLEGSFEHKDSRGNRGKLSAGDVQWMTAGGGVVHSEMPSEEIQRNGGRVHGFQLWVNLPRRDKMMKPRYQEIASSSIPTASRDGVTVRVIAGESLGEKAVIETRTPIMYLHVKLDAGARFEQPVPREYNAFAFVVKGTARIDGREAGEDDAVIFGRDGDDVVIESEQGCELLLIGGVPINEPVVRYGPFVMNTERELLQAFSDFRSGRMGTIDF
jgi:redox-sensitive bicupin YhaK (pirin superfamily)